LAPVKMFKQRTFDIDASMMAWKTRVQPIVFVFSKTEQQLENQNPVHTNIVRISAPEPIKNNLDIIRQNQSHNFMQ